MQAPHSSIKVLAMDFRCRVANPCFAHTPFSFQPHHVRPPGNDTLGAALRLPSAPGAYTLELTFQRTGYSSLSHRTRITVRPLASSEHARFLPAARFYYASCAAMVVALLVFSVAFACTPAEVRKVAAVVRRAPEKLD